VNDNGILADANWILSHADNEFEGSVLWNAERTEFTINKEDRDGLRAEFQMYSYDGKGYPDDRDNEDHHIMIVNRTVHLASTKNEQAKHSDCRGLFELLISSCMAN